MTAHPRPLVARLGAAVLVMAVLQALVPALPVPGPGPRPAAAAVSGQPEDAPDELSPEEDNAEPGHDTCGGEPTSPAGSRIVRKLIDGPRTASGGLAFTSGVCIYLPPGYEAGGRRYPVLYLLHGAFGWQDDWVVQGDVQGILDAARAEDPAADLIVVMPDGTSLGRWLDQPDGEHLVETYVIDQVIPYVDTWFRTIPDRRGRAMAGLSNGGAGTLRMAAHHPDRFGVVTAMSAAIPVNLAADRTDVHAVHNDPVEVAGNLEHVELALVYGVTCGTPEECATYTGAHAFELACCDNEPYRRRLDGVRQRAYRYEPTDGAHDWYFWQRWLAGTHGEFLRSHLADPTPGHAALPPLAEPDRFDFRSTDPVVRIYDHTFATDPDRAAEFLTLEDVTADGLTVRGSGRLHVTTAARHDPCRPHAISGTGLSDAVVLAGPDGRLAFEVDLGPAHTAPEGSPAAQAAEVAAAGGYWTSRMVRITPAGEGGCADGIRWERLAGADRAATAVATARAAFPDGAPVAVVASADAFADALAGGPLAGALGGPVLLTGADALPSVTALELRRLAPEQIVVVGGPAAVGEDVVGLLEQIAPVDRLAGEDRYATAAAAARALGAGAVVHVASGEAFADALAAGASAASAGGPLLLTGRDDLPDATAEALEELAPERIVVVGGPAAVAEDVVVQLGRIAPVVRLAGGDRYATAAAVAGAAPQSGVVLLATGEAFPDALTAAGVAVPLGAPVLLVRPQALPPPTASALQSRSPGRIVVLGGHAAVGPAVVEAAVQAAAG